MTEAEIRTALGMWLQGVVNVPEIVWRNKDKALVVPCLLVEFVPVSRTGLVLGADRTSARGYMQVTVVTAINALESEALRWADEIAAAFPKGLRIDEGEMSLEILQPALVGQGYPDGAHWRLPVRIDYLALGA